ncbi:MAG: amino acid permease [Methanothrix sp.]|nr:MAG: amino acid permease [Methanothrix sp.]
MKAKAELKRVLGLFEITLSGIGIILGAGIYALIGEAAGLAGNAVWLSFAISSLVALLTGLAYAELSSMFPRASAEYEYTAQAFSRFPAFVIGWLIIFSGVIGAATVSLGFAGYFQALTGAPILPAALVLVALLAVLIFTGIKQSARFAIAFTLIEAAGLFFVIVVGIPHLGSVNYLEMPFGLSGVFQASALIFFAFIGFEDMVKLSEEAEDPEKNIPRGLILAISASIILYILVALCATSVLGWQELSTSSAPFSDIAHAALGRNASLAISVMALFATTNTVLLMLLAASRIVFGMAESSSLPLILASVHPRTKTPWAAVVLVTIMCMAFVFLQDISFVANVNNFTVFLTFMVINAALIRLRYRRPELARPFRVPFSWGKLPILPLLGIVVNLFLMLQLSWSAIALGAGLTILGAAAAHFLDKSSSSSEDTAQKV